MDWLAGSVGGGVRGVFVLSRAVLYLGQFIFGPGPTPLLIGFKRRAMDADGRAWGVVPFKKKKEKKKTLEGDVVRWGGGGGWGVGV